MGCGASSGAVQDEQSEKGSFFQELKRQLTFKPHLVVEKADRGKVVPVNLSTRQASQKIPLKFRHLLDEHGRFLVNFVAILERTQSDEHAENRRQLCKIALKPIPRPQVSQFCVKSHWMDNVRARKMCDEMLHLEDQRHPLPGVQKGGGGAIRNTAFMRTLQLSVGQQVNVLKMSNNPEVKIGGYFIISQMLGYIKSLVSLDLSSNNLRAPEARVLSLGLRSNHSVQELRMKDNLIGSEGATSMADMLKVNDTLLLMDLRMNSIRGSGMCALADAMSENYTLTDLDMRWNYAGECSDFVEMALLDMKDFCYRNMMKSLMMEAEKSNETDKLGQGVPIEDAANRIAISASPIPESPSFDWPPEEDLGRLEITILSARNLPQVIWTSGKDGEFMGLPQSYCTFSLNKLATTTAIMKRNWAPTWNHTVDIPVKQLWQVCSLRVMHSKSLSKTHFDDYIIGTVNIPVGAIINWRGVIRGDTIADPTWRAYHRQLDAPGKCYQICRAKASNGVLSDVFVSAVEAARAYDETAEKKDYERAKLNLSGQYDVIGEHVKDDLYPLVGEDGGSVIGVQAGVPSTVRLCLKFFNNNLHYVEIMIDKATCLPKMDSGLGTCDAYCKIVVGDYQFKTRVVRNSLDPEFKQSFRIAISGPKNEDFPMDIKFSVWDWDKWNEDDHMGDTEITVNTKEMSSTKYNKPYTVMQPKDPAKPDQALPLQNSKKENSQLHLRFRYMQKIAEDDDEYE